MATASPTQTPPLPPPVPFLYQAEKRKIVWLNAHNYAFAFIDQTPSTFAGELRGRGKRPDFIVNIEQYWKIALDVKGKRLNSQYLNFTLDADEVEKLTEWESLNGIQVWFAISSPDIDFQTWFYIRLSKVKILPRRYGSTGDFYSVKIGDCITVGHDDTYRKLVC